MIEENFKWNGVSTAVSKRVRIKDKIIRHYFPSEGRRTPQIPCMLLGKKFGRPAVIGAHLFKHEWHHLRKIAGLDDIDDLGNTFLLFAPIEKAFDRSWICFHVDKMADRSNMNTLSSSSSSPFFVPGSSTLFKLKLLKTDLKNKTLYESAKEFGVHDADMVDLDRNLTFGDLEGMELKSESGHLPYKTVIWY